MMLRLMSEISTRHNSNVHLQKERVTTGGQCLSICVHSKFPHFSHFQCDGSTTGENRSHPAGPCREERKYIVKTRGGWREGVEDGWEEEEKERMRGGAEDEGSLGYQSAMLLQLLET